LNKAPQGRYNPGYGAERDSGPLGRLGIPDLVANGDGVRGLRMETNLARLPNSEAQQA